MMTDVRIYPAALLATLREAAAGRMSTGVSQDAGSRRRRTSADESLAFDVPMLTVVASVRPQPDGTTRVEFNARGDTSQDPTLAQRVASSYNARMGR